MSEPGEGRGFRTRVGWLALAVPCGIGIFTAPLILFFRYPTILDASAPEVLERLGEAGAGITASWLGVTLFSFLLVLLAPLLHRVVRDEAGSDQRLAARMPYLGGITVIGIVAGFCMVLDLSQWVWAYPVLGRRYVDPATPAVVKSQLEITWEAFHVYLGRGIGIHIATISSAMWSLGLGWVLLGAQRHRRALPWLALASGGLFIVSIAPGSSFTHYAVVNSIGFAVWGLWLIGTGLVLIRGHRLTQPSRLVATENLGPGR